MHVRASRDADSEQERRPREPAELPLHALLALQQGAGNQAVGRVLARNRIKTPAAKAAVMGATKTRPKPTTADELLLAIYDKLGAGQGAPFATVDIAVTALTVLNVIDAGDAAYFREAAAKEFPGADAGAKKKESAAAALQL